MTQRYLTHFSVVVCAHLILILGGFQFFNSDYVQNSLKERVLQMKVMEGVFIPAARYAPPQAKKVSPTKAKPNPVSQTVETVSAPVETPASGVSQGTATGVENGIGAGSGGSQVATLKDLYKAELRAKIDQNKSYPSMSKRLGQQGEVVVSFTVLADGKIKDIKVDKASRFEALNASAEEAVRRIKKFKPIPAELGLDKMDVRIPIRYSLVQ